MNVHVKKQMECTLYCKPRPFRPHTNSTVRH